MANILAPDRYLKQPDQLTGRMRHRLSFRTFTESQGSDGSLARTWTTEAEQWGEVLFTVVGSAEEFEAEQVVHRMAATVTVRYRNDIRPKHRILYEGLEYDIISVLPDPKQSFLVIEAVQVEPMWASFTG